MVLSNLSNSLQKSLSKIKNSITCDKTLIEQIIKEIQKSMLNSDVNVHLVLELTQKIRKRAIEEKIEGLNKKEHLIKIIYEEFVNFLGVGEEYKLKKGLNKIMLVGLYGQGKTTTTIKLLNYFKLRSKKACAISLDTYRAAAFEQLKQLAKQNDLEVFGDPTIKNAVDVYKKFQKKFKEYDVVLIDSSGRDSLNKELINEINNINKFIKPTDIFLVMGADVGQTAQKQSEMFKKNLDISGVIITKMDGTSKGGGALSSCKIVDAPVRFIGVGENITELEKFNSKNFVSQLLGMGDIETLLEKAKLVVDEKSQENIMNKFQSGNFDLNDLYSQMKSMKKMGSMTKMLGLIPGMSNLNISKDMMNQQEGKIEKWKFLLDSMTKNEKKNPQIINVSRKNRVCKGSGIKIDELNELLKQFKVMKKMMGGVSAGDMDEKGITDMMSGMKDPAKMLKLAKKMGVGGKMIKGLKKGF